MAELILTEKENIKNVADKVRILSGDIEEMTLGTMESCIDVANEIVDTQTDLISQIVTALEGKASGGGGSLETCTVTYTEGGCTRYFYADVVEGDERICKVSEYWPCMDVLTHTISNVVVGSMFVVFMSDSPVGWECSGDVMLLVNHYDCCNVALFRINGDGTISDGT